MAQNNSGIHTNLQKIFAIGAWVASVGYFFSIATGSIGMMIFILTWLANFKNLRFKSTFSNMGYVLLWVFYLALILCSIYSLDKHQANKEVLRFLSFLIFPLIFVTYHQWSNWQYRFIKKGFLYALIVFFLICLGNAFYRQWVFSGQGGPFNWYFFYRYDFLEIFRQHPTYISMFTLLGLSFLMFEFKNPLFHSTGLKVLIECLLISAIVLYGSRMGYILLFLFAGIYLLKLIQQRKTIAVLFIFGGFILFLVTAWNIPIVKERVLYTLGEKYDYQFNNKASIIDGTPENQGRLLLWQDAWSIIEKSPFFGHGTGSSKKLLSEKYKEEGHEVFLNEKYNAHNTYIELLIWGGFALLILYLIVLVYGIKFCFHKKDYIGVSFFLILVLTGLTETIFLAQGILFFAFFYAFFINKKLDET